METQAAARFERLREQAIALRRAGLSRRQIRDRIKVHNNDILNRLLEGEPPPHWTKRPNAKDDLRARAREMRLQGMTYDEIQAELGVSKSSVSLWVRDLPKPAPRRTQEEQLQLMKDGLARLRGQQEVDRARTRQTAFDQVGALSDDALFAAGVALYWAEGSKSKTYDRRERVAFVNSDPGVIQLFLSWLDLIHVDRRRLRFRLMIHETGDEAGAIRYWADLVGSGPETFQKTTVKKHNPKTVRKNTGDAYRGCLVITVRDSAALYLAIEGWWAGMVNSATGRPDGSDSSGKV